MYTAPHRVLYGSGLHDATMYAFKNHFPPGVVWINNIDVTDIARIQQNLHMARDIEISVNTGDPETDKNVWDIIAGVANFGRDPWRGLPVIPPQLYQKMADYVRSIPEFGLQGGFQTQPSAPVSGEMTTSTKLAMWSVVSLGELQQPGAVGETQGYNPITDGPNPDGPNFEDNSQNSMEQEQAFQTWVNHAVNLLNQGNDAQVVLAQLAHDGCPEPESVLKTALEQPEKSVMDEPITDEIGQDPFNAPVADDQTGQMQDVFRQPPVVQAKVRIAGTTLTGVEIDRWEDMWGQGTVKVALDDGGTMNVSPDAVEPLDAEVTHPVSQIQEFIDSLPKVEPTRPHIQARIDNLELVRRAVRSTISKVGFSDQVKLMKYDTDAQFEIEALKESLGATISESDVAYLSGQQTYRPQGLDLPGVERVSVIDPDFQKKIAEKAAIFVAELSDDAIQDADGVAYAAARYASENNGNVQEFVRLAEENRVVRVDEFSPVEESTEPPADYEGPAEGIYL